MLVSYDTLPLILIDYNQSRQNNLHLMAGIIDGCFLAVVDVKVHQSAKIFLVQSKAL